MLYFVGLIVEIHDIKFCIQKQNIVILGGCDYNLRSVKNLFGFFSLINSVYGFVSDTEEIICDNKFLIGNTDESWLEHKRMPIIVQ